MPYEWKDPDMFMEYKGIKIYHCYDEEKYDEPLNHWFTTNIKSSSSGNYDDLDFDVRDLGRPEKSNYDEDSAEFDKECIKFAIDNKELELPEGVKYENA